MILPPDGVAETTEPNTGVKVSEVNKVSEVVTRQSELEVIVTSFVPAASSAERPLLENAIARAAAACVRVVVTGEGLVVSTVELPFFADKVRVPVRSTIVSFAE